MPVIALASWTFAGSCFHIQQKTVLTSHPSKTSECSACSLEPVAPGDMHCYHFPGNLHEILYCLSDGSVCYCRLARKKLFVPRNSSLISFALNKFEGDVSGSPWVV